MIDSLVGMAASPTGREYWLLGRDGGIFGFGDATPAGDMSAVRLFRPIIGMM